MDESTWLAARFEKNRKQLRSVAYRMLGSLSEADDAVQEAWLRPSRSEASHIDNLGGWLTTVVARISLDMLRARRRSRIEGSAGGRVPDPIIVRDPDVESREEASGPESTAADTRDDVDPEHQAIMAESISLALLVVLETHRSTTPPSATVS